MSIHPDFEAISSEVEDYYGDFIEEINKGTSERDRTASPISREQLKQAGELGLSGFTVAKEAGGQGRSHVEWGMLLREFGRLCTDRALPLLLAYRQSVTNMLFDTGRQDLIDRYVRPMVKGECFGGFGWSEDKDPFSFKTSIHKTSQGYVLEGQKIPIAGAQTADVFLVLARREDDDLMVVLVERDDPGVEIKPYVATGLRALGLGTVHFEGVRLQSDRIIAKRDGVSYGQRFFNERRTTMPCWALGCIEALFEHTVKELSQRIRYGLPVTEMQTVQAALGRVHVSMEASLQMILHSLNHVLSGEYNKVWDLTVTTGKYFVVEQALASLRTLQSIVGGAAVFAESPYERAMRDLHCLIPIAGTQQLLECDIGNRAITLAQMKFQQQRRRSINEDSTFGQSASLFGVSASI